MQRSLFSSGRMIPGALARIRMVQSGVQRRMIFGTAQQATVASLKQRLDDRPTTENALAYLRELNVKNPADVMEQIERGWLNNKLPFNNEFLVEFLKAASSLNRLDDLNIVGLLKLAGAVGANRGSAAAGDYTSVLAPLLAGSRSSGVNYGAGYSSSNPLHVVTVRNYFKEAVGKSLATIFAVGAGLLVLSYFVDIRMGGGPGQLNSKPWNTTVTREAGHSDKTFDDVVGVEEAKAELEEIVMYLQDPDKFTRLGGRLPKGVLLTGPPGTGKTLLAQAIAGEADVPFFYMSGSEFDEVYVGVGAKRIRDLFETAKAKSPCIIFIDEIDAVGGSRHLKDQSAMKMTLNQLLVEMDGFAQNNGIIVIGATNFPDSLDPALVRPGRFDKHVDVPLPDLGGRKAILDHYCKRAVVAPNVDVDQLARGTPGFSGADLFNLVNQAALKASMDGMKTITMACLEYAKDKILMGAERRSAFITPETLKTTAYHEAGHALVAILTAGADPIHKATIMPRGRALGMVVQMPDGDQTSISRKQMLARLDICMGGRVAEELVFGVENVTSGASSDIQQATRLAKAMVSKYGMSEKIGVVYHGDEKGSSSSMQSAIDEEVKLLLASSYERAKALIESHRDELENIAKALLSYESLSGEDIVKVMEGKPVDAQRRSQKPSRVTQPVIVTLNSPVSSKVNLAASPAGNALPSAVGKVVVPQTTTPKSIPSATIAPPSAPPTSSPSVSPAKTARPPASATPSASSDAGTGANK